MDVVTLDVGIMFISRVDGTFVPWTTTTTFSSSSSSTVSTWKDGDGDDNNGVVSLVIVVVGVSSFRRNDVHNNDGRNKLV